MALHMAGLVTAMIDDVIAAFEKETLGPIKEFSVCDNTGNTFWHSTFQEMLTFLMNNPTTTTRSTYCIMLTRYLRTIRGSCL